MDQLLANIFVSGLLILGIYWYITDPRSLSEKTMSNFGLTPGYSRNGLLITFILLLIYSLFLKNFSSQLPPSPLDFPLMIIGILLYIIGWTLALWARVTMKEKWLPAGGGHDAKRQNEVIISGPFRFTRNPLYLGLIILFLGIGIAMRSYYVLLILIPIIAFYKAAVNEEQMLERHFGKKYLHYKEKVKRFI